MQTSNRHMGNLQASFRFVWINPAERAPKPYRKVKAVSGLEKLPQRAMYQNLHSPPPKINFLLPQAFQMGNNNRGQHFLSNRSVQAQSHVPFSDSILFLHQPYTVSVFIISIFRGAIMAHGGKVPCLLTPSCVISQTRSKILITTHQFIAICGLVYNQFNSPVNTAHSTNFWNLAYHQYINKHLFNCTIMPLSIKRAASLVSQQTQRLVLLQKTSTVSLLKAHTIDSATLTVGLIP